MQIKCEDPENTEVYRSLLSPKRGDQAYIRDFDYDELPIKTENYFHIPDAQQGVEMDDDFFCPREDIPGNFLNNSLENQYVFSNPEAFSFMLPK